MITKPTPLSHTDLVKILDRVLGEVVIAIKMRQVLIAMRKSGVTTWTRKWFRVMALEDAIILRLVRILDNSRNAVGFPLLMRSVKSEISTAAASINCNLVPVFKFATRLREIRNKTFIHADINVVGSSAAFWKARGLTWKEVDRVLNTLHRLLTRLHYSRTKTTWAIPKFERPLKRTTN